MISSYLIVEMCDFDDWGWAGGRSRKKILGLRTWPRDFLLWAMRLVGYFFFHNCPAKLLGMKLALKCATSKPNFPLMCYLVLANQNSKGMYCPSRSGRERKARKL